MSYGEIGARFRKDAEFARRVEGIALMRNSLGLLADS